MQICRCLVNIGGENSMQVIKERVSVPELLVLLALHGDDAVRNIEVVDEEDCDSGEERARLSAIYTMPANIVRDTLGAQGGLPSLLSDTSIHADQIISAGKSKGRKKATAAEEVTAADIA